MEKDDRFGTKLKINQPFRVPYNFDFTAAISSHCPIMEVKSDITQIAWTAIDSTNTRAQVKLNGSELGSMNTRAQVKFNGSELGKLTSVLP